MQGEKRGACFREEGRTESNREKRKREFVEAHCTSQSRPGCLVAHSNQTWCHRQLNLGLEAAKGGGGWGVLEKGGHFPLPRITLWEQEWERVRKGKSGEGRGRQKTHWLQVHEKGGRCWSWDNLLLSLGRSLKNVRGSQNSPACAKACTLPCYQTAKLDPWSSCPQ